MSEGILELIQFAEWESSIVPVLKADNQSVTICGDFKLLNKSQSKIEDLFTCITGGKT